MRGFLLDTNVISMLAPSRGASPRDFLDWLERMDGDGRIFLSVITIQEIEKGIALLEHKGAVTKATGLKVWLTGLIVTYDDKIISLNATEAMIAGRLEANAISAGYHPGMADAAIAGIAQVHDLHIITRNTKHFMPFNVAASMPDEAIKLK
ncbi:MAG: type II toxin-antitoxin system VapC family toxin [Methylocystaceae bacterium]|nr:type II toxin-antitoxin system VapC family toxin [Methylocystaceae bacterium]